MVDDITLLQAKTLNTIGLRYCGDDQLRRIADRKQSDLVSYCSEHWKESTVEFHLSASTAADHVARDWDTWQRLESRRRLGYCIWLLDCMWAFHTDCRPLLSLRDAIVPLPCQEVLWEAETASVWRQLQEVATSKSRAV